MRNNCVIWLPGFLSSRINLKQKRHFLSRENACEIPPFLTEFRKNHISREYAYFRKSLSRAETGFRKNMKTNIVSTTPIYPSIRVHYLHGLVCNLLVTDCTHHGIAHPC